MEARKKVSKNDFPRLAYIVSDVIVYVNTGRKIKIFF